VSRTFEEYRYDGLGRRILVRSRRECQYSEDATCAAGMVRRTVWDGAAELLEVQMPDSAAWRENDTVHVGSVWARAYGFSGQCGLSAFAGRIAYVQGPDVDQPLEVVRVNLEAQAPNVIGIGTCADSSSYNYIAWPAPLVYSPIYNWRGVADEGTLANGAARSYIPITSAYGFYANPPWQDIVDNFNRFGPGVDQWFGEVITQKKDGSGQMFRRNRYYDPQTGLFTQEDPIGLAGGLSSYGFTSGDPINYADPFGLCPCIDGFDFGPALQEAGEISEDAGNELQGGVAGVIGGVALIGADMVIGDLFSSRQYLPTTHAGAASDASAVAIATDQVQTLMGQLMFAKQPTRIIPDRRKPHREGTREGTREKHENTRKPNKDKKRQGKKWKDNPSKPNAPQE
jgi:RHS repeat-associated protein